MAQGVVVQLEYQSCWSGNIDKAEDVIITQGRRYIKCEGMNQRNGCSVILKVMNLIFGNKLQRDDIPTFLCFYTFITISRGFQVFQ